MVGSLIKVPLHCVPADLQESQHLLLLRSIAVKRVWLAPSRAGQPVMQAHGRYTQLVCQVCNALHDTWQRCKVRASHAGLKGCGPDIKWAAFVAQCLAGRAWCRHALH